MQSSDDEQWHEEEEVIDLHAIMRAFGVQDWHNLGPAEGAPSAQLSLLIDIQGERYLLKERQEVPIAADPHHRYAFQHYLQQQGIPIPPLRLTPQGEPFVAIGEDYFELQQLPGGEIFSSAAPQASHWIEHAGRMLGRIHLASQHYQGPQHRWPSEVHIGALVQGWLNLARSKADQLTLQPLSTALSHWADQWEAVLPSAMMSIGATHDLPEFHIHGDYHAHNLRFGPFGVVAVLGLEASRWEKRIFEVAFALFSFSALQWETQDGRTRPLTKRGLEPEYARRFLHAYAELCPPARGEAALLSEALTLVAPIATINGPLEDLFFSAYSLDEEALLNDMLERLTWASALPSWLTRVKRSLAEMWA